MARPARRSAWALTENQMSDSAAYVEGVFRYERLSGEIGHRLQLKDDCHVNRLVIGSGAKPAT